MKQYLKYIIPTITLILGFVIGGLIAETKAKSIWPDVSSSSPYSSSESSSPADSTPDATPDIHETMEYIDFVYSGDKRSVTIRFVALYDIQNFQVKVVLNDKDGFLLDSQVITVGNVIHGQQYLVTVSLPDNDFTAYKQIQSVAFNFYGGTIAN